MQPCFQLYQAFDLGEWGRRDDLPEIDPGEPESHSAWYFPKNDLNLTAHRALPLQLRVGSGINFSCDRNGGWSGLHCPDVRSWLAELR